jgi:hypothetical protein
MMRRLGFFVLLTTLAVVLTDAPRLASPPFVKVCGMQLCLKGQPWRIHGATAYGQYGNADAEVAFAKLAGINTLDIVEFETRYHNLSDTMSEATWRRVDNVIGVAKQSGLHVILNLSSYGQSLMAAGHKPMTTDWSPYLRFIVNRINTTTGVRYGDEPTIAKIELYDEIDAPNYNVPLRGTAAETTAFFARTLSQFKRLDANHVISTGGFSYINDTHSGIDWETIVADRNDATCDVEINSYPDRNISVPIVSSYCRQLDKPWFLSAWSSCYKNNTSVESIDDWLTDTDMAAHARDMYDIERNRNPAPPGPVVAALGSDFWNFANRPLQLGMCDIGQQFPRTLAVVKANAP